jgi:hypothetical protein
MAATTGHTSAPNTNQLAPKRPLALISSRIPTTTYRASSWITDYGIVVLEGDYCNLGLSGSISEVNWV